MTFYVLFLVKISLPPFPTKIPRFAFQGLFSRNFFVCAKKTLSQKFHGGEWNNPTNQLYPQILPQNSIANPDLRPKESFPQKIPPWLVGVQAPEPGPENLSGAPGEGGVTFTNSKWGDGWGIEGLKNQQLFIW